MYKVLCKLNNLGDLRSKYLANGQTPIVIFKCKLELPVWAMCKADPNSYNGRGSDKRVEVCVESCSSYFKEMLSCQAIIFV